MLFKFAIKDFLDDRKLKNLSPATIKSYENTLEHFHRYLTQNEKVNVEDVTQADIKGYLMYCREEGENRPTSLNHKIGNLKVFFNYMAEVEIIEINPMKKVHKLKTDVKIEAFTDYHIKLPENKTAEYDILRLQGLHDYNNTFRNWNKARGVV